MLYLASREFNQDVKFRNKILDQFNLLIILNNITFDIVVAPEAAMYDG